MSEGSQREELHHRQVDLRFFRRRDGLYEVEGTLVDTKSQPFRRQLASSDTPPGEPLHDMTLVLVLDEALEVKEVSARMRATPFDVCSGASQTLAPLVGHRIGPGWNQKVRELLRGAASCSHLRELLGPMATTALQGLAPQRLARLNEPGREQERQAKVDSCYAYASHREVVSALWPDLHRPASAVAPHRGPP